MTQESGSEPMFPMLRNVALAQLQSVMPKGVKVSVQKVPFCAGQLLECPAGDTHSMVFPEQGVLLLLHKMGARVLDAALLGSATALVVPAKETPLWQLRALRDGWAHTVAIPLPDMENCASQVLKLQLDLMAQVAIWGHCRQHHPLPQRLATLLAALQNDASQWDWHCWTDMLNIQQPFLEAGLKALAQTGALALEGSVVHVLKPQVLARQACSCLQRLVVSV